METVERVLRAFVDSPSRRGIVLIVTLGLALAILWPLADDYVALRERRASAAAELTRGELMYRGLGELEKRVVEREAAVAQRKADLVSEKYIHPFRDSLIKFAREAGCKVRNVDAGERTIQEFDKSERIRSAFGKTAHGTLAVESPYAIAIQPVDLKLVGSLSNLELFLSRLKQENALIHTDRITFQPDRSNPTQVELEMMIEVFDLIPQGARNG